MTDRELLELLLLKITNIEGEQRVMRVDITSIKDEQKVMKADIASIKGEQQSMRTDITYIKTEQVRHGDLLHQLIQIVGATNAHVYSLDVKVDSLAEEMRQGFKKTELDIDILFEENLNRRRETKQLQTT